MAYGGNATTSASFGNVDILCKVLVSGSGGVVAFRVVSGDYTQYQVSMPATLADGWYTGYLQVITSGAYTDLGSWSQSGFVDRWLRIQASGYSPTVIRVRTWNVGDSEPGTWDVDTSDNAAANQVASAPLRLGLTYDGTSGSAKVDGLTIMPLNAVSATAVVSAIAPVATVTVAGLAPTAWVQPFAPAASAVATGRAPSPVAGVSISAGSATATAAGNAPTVTGMGLTSVSAGLATVATSGNAPTVTGLSLASVSPSAAASTAAGQAPAVQIRVTSAAAGATGAGNAPIPQVQVTSGYATVTGTGRAPTVNTWAYPAAGTAAASATANAPVPRIHVWSAAASVTAAAYAATAIGSGVLHFAPSVWAQNVSPQAGTFMPPDVVVVGSGGPVPSVSATVATTTVESATPEMVVDS
jgi:hypothetical protein